MTFQNLYPAATTMSFSVPSSPNFAQLSPAPYLHLEGGEGARGARQQEPSEKLEGDTVPVTAAAPFKREEDVELPSLYGDACFGGNVALTGARSGGGFFHAACTGVMAVCGESTDLPHPLKRPSIEVEKETYYQIRLQTPDDFDDTEGVGWGTEDVGWGGFLRRNVSRNFFQVVEGDIQEGRRRNGAHARMHACAG